MGDGIKSGDIVFISYLNDDGTQRHGSFEVIELNSNFVEIKTSGSTLLIPFARVLKIKRKEVSRWQ